MFRSNNKHTEFPALPSTLLSLAVPLPLGMVSHLLGESASLPPFHPELLLILKKQHKSYFLCEPPPPTPGRVIPMLLQHLGGRPTCEFMLDPCLTSKSTYHPPSTHWTQFLPRAWCWTKARRMLAEAWAAVQVGLGELIGDALPCQCVPTIPLAMRLPPDT